MANGTYTDEELNQMYASGYKNQILAAISEIKNDRIKTTNIVSEKKKITLAYIGTFYSKLIVKNVKNYLIGINKEERRDTLTKYELIWEQN